MADKRPHKLPKPNSSVEGAYHHGDLQEALIAATEDILAESGAEGFTLREAARRAGVSPAAPSHHFGNAPGLLTEVAIRGYKELERLLAEAAASEASPRRRLLAQGLAYVGFALDHPGLFQMMFSNKRLSADDERLRLAARSAHAAFEQVMADVLAADGTAGSQRQAKAASVAAWSAVHGFAKLALEDKFGAAGDAAIKTMLRDMLAYFWPQSEAAAKRR